MQVDLCVHYDIVTSSLRKTQRNGRTGRRRPGKILHLYLPGEHKRVDRADEQEQKMSRVLEEAIKASRGGWVQKRGKRQATLHFVKENLPMLPPDVRPQLVEVALDLSQPFDPGAVRGCVQ